MNSFFKKRSFWVLLKLFFYELVSDYWTLILLLIVPISVSVLWILLVEYDIIPEVPDTERFSNPLTLWYEYTIFLINLVGLIYLALKFSQFCKSVLFRKIIVAQVSFWKIILVSLTLFFILSIFMFLLKFALLMYYPVFRKEIADAQILPWIGGFLALIFTFLSLGLLFSTAPISPTSLTFLAFIVSTILLVLGGFFLNIEFLLSFEDWSKGPQFYEKINSATKIYRMISFISPFQPSMQIIQASHLNENWRFVLTDDNLNIFHYRPMIYSNYWSPFLVNLLWIVSINLLNYVILVGKKY